MFRSKRMPVAFLLALAVVIGSHIVAETSGAFWRICLLYAESPKDDAILLDAAFRAMPPTTERHRVLLVGSSLTQAGFDANYLNEQLQAEGFEFHNLGVAGSSQPIDLFMIKDRLLAKNPDTIVYMPFVESFYEDYDVNDYNKLHQYFSFAILPRLINYFGWEYVIDQQRPLIDSLLGKVSIFYRYRKSFVRIAERLAGAALSGEWRTKPKGFGYNGRRPPAYFDEIVELYKDRYHLSEYTKLNEQLFEEFAREVMASGTHFVVIDGPVHPKMNLLATEEARVEYPRFLADSASRIGFTLIEGKDLPPLSDQDFVDVAHLNASGRRILSRFMESYLRGEMVATRAGNNSGKAAGTHRQPTAPVTDPAS